MCIRDSFLSSFFLSSSSFFLSSFSLSLPEQIGNTITGEEEWEEEKGQQMRVILGESKAHYAPLIEQLLFMEVSHCG